MTAENSGDATKIKRLKKPGNEFLALTTSLDQKLSLNGTLRAVGLTAETVSFPQYCFGSVTVTSTKHYPTGDTELPSQDVIKCRLFDLSRTQFFGIKATDASIDDDIVTVIRIENLEQPSNAALSVDCDLLTFLDNLALKVDNEVVAIITVYIKQLLLLNFTLIKLDYVPSDFVAMVFTTDTIKVMVTYYIDDHIKNIRNYHVQ